MTRIPYPMGRRALAQLTYIQTAARDLAARAGLPAAAADKLGDDLGAIIRRYLADDLHEIVLASVKRGERPKVIAETLVMQLETIKQVIEAGEMKK